MLSIPPVKTSSASPARIAVAASIAERSPEPQTMLTVKALDDGGIPAKIATCRAGTWPKPAESTLPTIVSSNSAGSTPALLIASRRRRAKWTADRLDNPPKNRPIGVRHAERITGVITRSSRSLFPSIFDFSLTSFLLNSRAEPEEGQRGEKETQGTGRIQARFDARGRDGRGLVRVPQRARSG